MAQQTPASDQAQAPAPTPNTAQAPADPNNTAPATLQTVTVTGTRPSEDFVKPNSSLDRVGDLRDTPQSVTVITKALMQSQGSTSLTSAISKVPGVTIGAAEGGQIGNNINLNGFSARTDLYVDGMRDAAQYYRDTFALEEIEVLMGPSSMLFGRGSTGGVINQVMKKPSLTRKEEYGVSITTNRLIRGTADINIPTSDTSAARVATMFQQGAASTRHQTDVLDFGVAPSYKFGIGTPTEITFYGLLQHNHDQADYGLPPVNFFPARVNRDNAYGFGDDRTEQDILFVGASIRHKFNDQLTLRNQTQLNYVNTNARETAPQAIGTVTGAGGFVAISGPTNLPLSSLYVRQQSHDRNIFQWSLYNQSELTAKFDTGSVKHNLLAGIDLGYESYYNQNYYRNGTCNGVPMNPATGTSGYASCTSLLDPVGTPQNNNVVQQPSNLATAQARAFGAYMNDTITIIPEVKLVGGVRYDVYWSQIGNSINSLNTAGNNSAAYNERTDTYTSVRGGPIFQPDKVQTYYASYSTSFNPSLEQLVGTTGATTQPLPPTTNEAFEIGAKYDFLGGNLQVTGAAFQITQNNARSQNPDGTYSATGQIQVKGIRAGVTGRITDEWQVWAGYTYLDARILNGIAANTSGMVPLNTPRDAAVLWSTYTFAKTYEIGGGVNYIGQRYANNTNTTVVPEFYRFDATAAYKQPTYDVRLNVFNLLNTTNFEQVIPSDGGRAVPGTGLTAMLSYVHHM
ncbi:MAG: TonB-dependent siderophore receptor [Proteobacteria bacterium]|nr:TonB-dependent siderophore receptor [Pseudomonadota bacterium]